jgi:hypothetical protein
LFQQFGIRFRLDVRFRVFRFAFAFAFDDCVGHGVR